VVRFSQMAEYGAAHDLSTDSIWRPRRGYPLRFASTHYAANRAQVIKGLHAETNHSGDQKKKSADFYRGHPSILNKPLTRKRVVRHYTHEPDRRHR
jgi:hypothetical protein